MTELKLGCVVMAAGNASRFGKNKLAADFGGATLITRALRTIPKERFERITVVTQYDEIAALAKEFGFDVIYNRHPDWGISHTVALGTEAMQDCDAIMYQVSDQPLLRRESVEALLLPAFLPFNILKAGLNTALVLMLYKPLVTALRRIGLVQSGSSGERKSRAGIYLLAAILLLTCVLVILALQGKI